MVRPVLVGGLAALCGAVAHADIPLRLPVDCTPGVDCYIQNFVDHDLGQGSRDFTCGSLTYDGHKGTDFALSTRAALARGVDVLAAAPGTVRGVRDTMADAVQGGPNAPDVDGRECGNGVVISHGDGWETQYCHLARGSVTVVTGQRVGAGHVLGQIGLSGRTEFPHLHLSVRKDGTVVDPFDPDGDINCAAVSPETLWTEEIIWQPGGLLDAGFASGVPDYDEIKAGTVDEALTVRSPALVFFVLMYGSQPGDLLELSIAGPDGEVFRTDETLERAQAQLFRAGGRRTPANGWPEGDYRGLAVLYREGAEVDRIEATIALR